MKNKYKLLTGIVIIIILLFIIYFGIGGDIFKPTGLMPADTSILPKTHNRIITSNVHAIPTGNDTYSLFQKYRVGHNEFCIRDCTLYCQNNVGLEYYKAYVQSYGKCMCKCLLPEQ